MLTVHQQLDDLVHFIFDVDTADLVARHHDVIDGNLLEIQDAHQHALVLVGNQRAGFVHHGAQLVGAELLGIHIGGKDSQQAQHTVGEPVDGGHNGIKDSQERLQNNRGRERNAFGVQRRQRLRRHFRKHQNHHGEHKGRESEARLAHDAPGDERRQHRGDNIDEVVAEQDQADEPVRAFQQLRGAFCPLVPALGEVAQAIPVQGHHAGFRTGEKRRKKDENNECPEQNTQGKVTQMEVKPAGTP